MFFLFKNQSVVCEKSVKTSQNNTSPKATKLT